VRSKLRPVLVAAVLLAAAAATAAPAAAGTYSVRQCDYAAGNGYHDFQWQASGSPAIAQYAGSGCGEFGLAARNGNGGVEQRYPSGGYGGWFAYAPGGTVITRFSGAFGTIVGCCINGLATYAEAAGPGGRAYLFQGSLGNDSWYAPSGLQGPVGRSWDASMSGFVAKSVGFYLRCGPGFSCLQLQYGDLRLRGRSFDFTLDDQVGPSIGGPSGTLTAGGWIRGSRTLSIWAGDGGGGLTQLAATFDNGTTLGSTPACTVVAGRYAKLQPCPLAHDATWTVDTSKLPDGVRTVSARATDVGGSVAGLSYSFKVDNTAPAAPLDLTVVDGDGWRPTNRFALRWSNPKGQHAPIVRARFRACPSAGGACIEGAATGEDLTGSGPVVLPRAGEWDVRVWLEDAAGNSDAALAAPPRRLRFDPDPPLLRFLEPEPGAAGRAFVEASDMSGIAHGEIELRRVDGGGWEALPTARLGSRLVAEIDDSDRRGIYALRARATDAAGNVAVVDGGTRTLPFRTATGLEAGFVGTLRRSAARARYRSTVRVEGRLAAADGRSLGDRPVEVQLVSPDLTRRLADARTDQFGRISLVLQARRSAVVQLDFRGDREALPSSYRLVLDVPAPVTMAGRRRRLVWAGRRVAFGGRVLGGSLPRGGKLVEIQAHFRGRWRTISAVRARGSGRWRFRYAFRPALRPATYRLRARVPAESAYPFATGVSRPVRVTVLPR
jgi:hypothetical protein